jgi:hypothetical protein
MAENTIPEKNTAYTFYVSLIDSASRPSLRANPTLAAGDVKVSTDGAAFGNITTLPVVTPSGSVAVKVDLSASEMNGDNVTVSFIDAAGGEWDDLLIELRPATRKLEDLAYPAVSGRSLGVDANSRVDVGSWLGTAVNATSAGYPDVNTARIGNVTTPATVLQRYADGVITGTCQGTGQTTTNIRLEAGESAVADIYDGWLLQIYTGTGAGQSRMILNYDATNKDCTVDTLATACDVTSKYQIVPMVTGKLIADAITSAKIAAGAIGSSEAPNLDAAISSRSSHSAADVWTSGTRTLTALGFTLVAGDFGAASLNGKGDWNTVTPLDAAGVRTAVGLAAANLDTQLADLPTVAEFNARTLVASAYFDPATDTVANVTTVATTTNLTNLPSIPANWITAAGITAGALNGKGDWNTVVPLDAAGTRTAVGLAAANLDTQLGDLPTVAEFNARTIPSATYFDPATDPVATVTNLTNLPAIPTNWLTAAGIAAGALNGKGDWNVGKTGYSISGTITTLDALENLSAAQVNAEVADVLRVDTMTLPGQVAPPLAPTFEIAVGWLYKVLRNRTSQTATQWTLYADDETTIDAKATVSDDGTTAIKQEIVAGP